MKSYTITVNGKAYDVQVVENKGGVAVPAAARIQSVTPVAAPVLKEYGMKPEDFILIDTCGAPDACQLMLTDDYASSYMLVGLCSAPSGVGMGELIIDLVENGTPIPCMTPYDLIIVDQDSALEFTQTYYPDAIV